MKFPHILAAAAFCSSKLLSFLNLWAAISLSLVRSKIKKSNTIYYYSQHDDRPIFTRTKTYRTAHKPNNLSKYLITRVPHVP